MKCKLNEAQINSLCLEFKTGETKSTLCKKYQVCEGTLNNYLRKGGIFISTKKTFVNENYFKVIDSDIKAYFLGLIYADGNINEKRQRLVINLQERDKEVLEFLHKEIEYTGKLSFWKKDPPRQNQYALSIYNQNIVQDLIKLGVSYNKTQKINLPVLSNFNFFSSFLRGFFDGDGSISIAKNRKDKQKRFSIVCLNNLAVHIKEVLNSNNIDININKCTEGKYTIKDLVCLTTSKKESIEKLYNFLYTDAKIYLNRKKKIFELKLSET